VENIKLPSKWGEVPASKFVLGRFMVQILTWTLMTLTEVVGGFPWFLWANADKVPDLG
jgi:hypothetical protein